MIDDEERLIDAMQDLAEELDRTPREVDMDDHGRFSSSPYERMFGSWNEAIAEAGLVPNSINGATNLPDWAITTIHESRVDTDGGDA